MRKSRKPSSGLAVWAPIPRRRIIGIVNERKVLNHMPKSSEDDMVMTKKMKMIVVWGVEKMVVNLDEVRH